MVALALAAPAQAINLPPGFADEPVTIVPRATAMDWTPDGRMVIVTHPGFVRIHEDGVLNPTPALDLRPQLCRTDEWGLTGIAVDPSFASNHFIYVYYTAKKFGGCEQNSPDSPVNRVSRFVLGDDDVVDPLSETVLIDGIPGPAGVHAGGDLEFGSDGLLYVATGDGGCDFRGDSGCFPLNDAAQDLGSLSGKILRITKDGGIPPGNPFQGPGTTPCSPTGFTDTVTKCQETYAYGFRNPFRIAVDATTPPGDVRLNINDVGLNLWEEVDAGQAGANYGWNVREGFCARNSTTNCGPPPPGMTNPIHSYNHDTGCVSITGGDFVPAGVWPQQYDDVYIFGDLQCEKVWSLEPDGSGGYAATEFATGIPYLIDGVFGPDGATKSYYYISWVSFPDDEIRRIRFVGDDNRSPTASANADPVAGDFPLSVEFDGSASSDPDDDTLTYDWDFGDGSPHSTQANPTHVYTSSGIFTATLTVDDGNGATDIASVMITVDKKPPTPTIDTPTGSQLFSVGEQLLLTGGATDPEDGTLPDSALTWRVEKHHSTHVHPFLGETTGNYVTITGPQPEDLEALTNTYLQIILTATDSDGLSTTVTRDVFPQTVDLTFDTSPSGLALELAGSTVTAPWTFGSWENWNVVATAQDQTSGGTYWHFDGWSDGGAATHTIPTPPNPASYTASFHANQAPSAAVSTDPSSGEAPLQVGFDGSASSDPDDDTLTYDWDFGDGSPHGTGASPSHTYASAGDYTATLSVSDGHGGTDSRSTSIEVTNGAPSVSISSPTAGKQWAVGEQIVLSGAGQDPEDGTLAPEALSWTVIKHHAGHDHVELDDVSGNDIPITGPAPEDLAATTTTSIEIALTATDSAGRSTTVTRTILPRITQLTFRTTPSGLALGVAGTTITDSGTFTSWSGWQVPVSASAQFDAQGRYWTFSLWSDSGAATHTITTPPVPTTYTANFTEYRYPRPGGGTPLRVPLVPQFRPCLAPDAVHAPPLSFDSCKGPSLESSLVGVSTAGKGVSFARIDAKPGIPPPNQDDADVRIKASVNDVSLLAAGAPDYTGKLVLDLELRMTNALSGPFELTPATVQDASFSLPIDCLATPGGGTVGSSCNVDTTADAVLPNFARERGRTIFSTTVRVLDAGPDEVITPSSDSLALGCPPICGSGDESVFMRQGVFTP